MNSCLDRHYIFRVIPLSINILAIAYDVVKLICFRHKSEVHRMLRRIEVLVQVIGLAEFGNIYDACLEEVEYTVKQEGYAVNFNLPEECDLLL